VTSPGAEDDRQTAAAYRYGVVFVLTAVLLAFVIIAPNERWSRTIAITLQWAALLVAVSTSHAREDIRRATAIAVAVAAVVVIVGVATDVLSSGVNFAVGGMLAVAVPISLVRGLLRLVNEHGVTIRAVAGSLAIYLMLGLAFAWLVGFIAEVGTGPYFAQGTNGNEGQWAYYSFTVLTTTGFGDLTPARPVGHAVAVIEMLMGQLYLVTVIGVLVGNFVRRRPAVDG
jgi:cytochrome c oxidase subunit IV